MKTYHLLGCCLAAALMAAAGCASQQQRAERAFESEDWDEAYSRYETLIEEGEADWKVYFRAARAATHLGNFSKAEKYYSRALRNGGGTRVARKFAEFYLQTSNYSQAVRLLQYLLETEPNNKQSLYNNLGTALMYAGSPLDAESYLLVAQQMEPEDPIPYVNLGVLYDRHIRRPQLAADFYKCYLKLADGKQGQQQRIRSRLSRISSQGRVSAGSQVECGKPYSPNSRTVADLEEKMKEIGGDSPGESQAEAGAEDKDPIDLGFGGSDGEADGEASASAKETRDRSEESPRASFEGMSGEASSNPSSEEAAGEGAESPSPDEQADATADNDEQAGDDERENGGEGEGPRIDRASEAPPEANRAGDEGRSGESGGGEATSDQGSRRARLERARQAFEHGAHERVVDEISELSLEEMNVDSMRIYGLSLAELGENEKARQWLEWVVERKPDPEVVGSLLEVYDRLDQSEDRRRICRQFRKRDAYSEVTESCPSPIEEMDEETLEKLRKQRKNQ